MLIHFFIGLTPEEERLLEKKLHFCYSMLGQELQFIHRQWERIKVGELDSPTRSASSDEGWYEIMRYLMKYRNIVFIFCYGDCLIRSYSCSGETYLPCHS